MRKHREKRQRGEGDGDAVERHDDAPLIPSFREEEMVDVLTVGHEDRLVTQKPAHKGERRVEDGHPHRDDRHEHREKRRVLRRPLEREDGEDESDEHRAGVAHENLGGIEVVEEEAHHRAGERRRDERDELDHVVDREDEYGKRDEEGDARRESVHSVNEVKGIDDADDPNHGNRKREIAELDESPRRIDAVYHKAEKIGADGNRYLKEELPLGGHAADIVEEPQPADEETAPDDDERIGDRFDEDLRHIVVVEVEEHEREYRSHGDADAADAGNATAVDRATVGDINDPPLETVVDKDWGHECHKAERDEERGEKSLHGTPVMLSPS